MQKFDSLAGKIGRLVRQSSDVAARSRQTCDQAAAERVVRQYKDGGNDRCRLLYCGGGGSGRDNDGDLQLTQSGHPTVKAVVFSCNLQMGYDLTGPVS